MDPTSITIVRCRDAPHLHRSTHIPPCDANCTHTLPEDSTLCIPVHSQARAIRRDRAVEPCLWEAYSSRVVPQARSMGGGIPIADGHDIWSAQMKENSTLGVFSLVLRGSNVITNLDNMEMLPRPGRDQRKA